jgi:hypothetical protein
MPYLRIENALSIASEHIRRLDPDDIVGQELETYLVAGLVVLIVSEYEEYLELLFVRRAESCGDSHAANYIKKTLSQKFRSPDLSKINETLGRFDAAVRDAFKSTVENSPHHAAWDSIMKARHAVVHKKGSLNLTFRELEANYLLTKQIVVEVEAVLSSTSA